MTKFNVDRVLVFIIGISLIIKILVSFFVQLGNDEVYYWTYALYPDWSHFDHPPMVGWMIQFFTFNLSLESEVFLRMGSIIIAGVNTYMMFRLGRLLKDELTGWYAAVLYSTSIYFGITAGFMILPDAPQLFFWILALFCLIKSLPVDPDSSKGKENMLFFGLAAGLAMMAKYTSVFLWIGALIYILFYNRSWLKSWVLYVSMATSLFLFSPVLLWNFENDFVSFSFHIDRIVPVGFQVQSFLIEVIGEFLYQNPLIYLLMVVALIALLKGEVFMDKPKVVILLISSIPLIITVWGFALFNRTLPHWSGPGFLGLIMLAAAFLAAKLQDKGKYPAWPRSVIAPGILFFATILLGTLMINSGMGIPSGTGEQSEEQLGSGEITLDMQGWKQIERGFSSLLEKEKQEGKITKDPVLISYKWFPAAHLDYYVARPLHLDLFAIGEVQDIRKYSWINNQRGGIKKGADAYCIAISNQYKDPSILYANIFEEIERVETIKVFRGDKHVRNAMVYRMKNYLGSGK